MSTSTIGSIAILYPGDQAARRAATRDNNRLATVFQALELHNIHAEPAVYCDELVDEVRTQLLGVDGVLVWRNPIQDGSDRSVLDPMLREVAASGVFVSAHPDVILKMGTKEVLHTTRHMEWGTDTRRHESLDALRETLPGLLQAGPRVLKQLRGNGGDGVWRVERAGSKQDILTPESLVRVRHAKRGAVEMEMRLESLFALCTPYFDAGAVMIDQPFQSRIVDGMIRCYMVRDMVAGFGHQQLNALVPAPEGAAPEDAPQPGQRLYHPPDAPAFQHIRAKVEGGWITAMQETLDITTPDLPILWDCDFMFGPRDVNGENSYVLCEINASSVAPYPDSAPELIATTIRRLFQNES